MNPQNKTSPQDSGKSLVKYIIAALVLLIGLVLYFAESSPTIVYCSFIRMVNETEPIRDECIHLKIMTKQIDQINFDSLRDTKGYVACYEDIKDLPKCERDNYYLSLYPLSLFCNNCSNEGAVCAAYAENFYQGDINESEFLNTVNMYQEDLMQEKYKYYDEWISALKKCER